MDEHPENKEYSDPFRMGDDLCSGGVRFDRDVLRTKAQEITKKCLINQI